MRKSTVGLLAAALAAAVFLSGCGSKPRSLTAGHNGRRVQDFEVEGKWAAYKWWPNVTSGGSGQLALLDMETGEEVSLDKDMMGPMALEGGRVVWWNQKTRDDENRNDVVLYDCATGEKKTLFREYVKGLDLEGKWLVYERGYRRGANPGSELMFYDLETGKEEKISSGADDVQSYNEKPVISGGVVCWFENAWGEKSYAVKTYDIQTGASMEAAVPVRGVNMSLSGGRAVYSYHVEGQGYEVHLFNVATGGDEVIAQLERLRMSPYIEGEKIVWCEHVRREDFRPIAGQPLLDERDVVDVYVYDIGSKSKSKVAGELFATGARPRLAGGRVYMNVYRQVPPPGQSNLTVPVDLCVFE